MLPDPPNVEPDNRASFRPAEQPRFSFVPAPLVAVALGLAITAAAVVGWTRMTSDDGSRTVTAAFVDSVEHAIAQNCVMIFTNVLRRPRPSRA